VSTPDPERSRAVLIGTYEGCQTLGPWAADLPGVAENLAELRRLLTDGTVWRLPLEHCRYLPQPADERTVLRQVTKAASEATDTLLVYFAGHGVLVGRDKQLYLALPGMEAEDECLAYDKLRERIRTHGRRTRRTVVILDCCYSGRALAGEMGAGPSPAEIEKLVATRADIEGACVLTAAAATRKALSPEGERFSAFTGELITVLRDGVSGGAEFLDMTTIYGEVMGRLADRPEVPEPQFGARGHGGDIVLSRNNAYMPDAEPEQVVQAPRAQVASLAELNPIDLGVHMAINPSNKRLPALTTYVPRKHDRQLRTLLDGSDRSLMVIAVGESSTGKTRAVYEAVLASPTLASWPVMTFSEPAELFRLLVQGVPARTILWLDETQTYLDGAEGRAIAVALRQVLTSGPGPVAVIGTMWPGHWERLTTDGDAAAPARRLLTLSSAHKIVVPSAFRTLGHSDGLVLSAAAREDYRLAVAQKTAGPERKVIQVLAGGVRLLELYDEQFDPRTKAIITAALDARRLGHHPAIPIELIRTAAPGYLTDAERVAEEGWFELALKRATRPVYGVSSLQRVRTGSKQTIGPADSVEVHDYLVENAQRPESDEIVPEALWRALGEHHSSDRDAHLLAASAIDRSHYRLAASFLVRGTLAGLPEARRQLCYFLEDHCDDPVPWLRWLALHGESSALWPLARHLQDSGRAAEALPWWRRLIESSNSSLMHDLRGLLIELELTASAETWLVSAAEQDSPNAAGALAMLLDGLGASRAEDRLRWWRKAWEQGDDESALWYLADALKDLGRLDEVEQVWHDLVENGRNSAAQLLIDLWESTDRFDKARKLAIRMLEEAPGRKWTRRFANRLAQTHWVLDDSQLLHLIADHGDAPDIDILAEALAATGRHAEAAEIRKSAEQKFRSSSALARKREEQGRLDDAERLWRNGLKRNGLNSLPTLVAFYERNNRIDDAFQLLEERLAGGDANALGFMAAFHLKHGQAYVAQRLLETPANAGDTAAIRQLARLHLETGDLGQAEAWLIRAVDAGDDESKRDLSNLLEGQGRFAEAIALWEPTALVWAKDADRLVDLLLKAGRPDAAEAQMRKNVLLGHHAVFSLRGHLEWTGRADEAEAVRRYGLEPDGSTCEPWPFPEPPAISPDTTPPAPNRSPRSV
jgi:TPR repeat protein